MIDYRDLMLEVGAEVESLMREFTQELGKPMMKTKFATMWAQLPEEQKEAFKRDQPEAYHALMESLK